MPFYSDMNQGVGREAGEASLHDSRGPSEVQNRPALLQLCGASYNAISTLSLGETKACCWVVEVNGTRQAQICIHMEACCVAGDQFPESRALRTRQVSFQCVSVCEHLIEMNLQRKDSFWLTILWVLVAVLELWQGSNQSMVGQKHLNSDSCQGEK